MSKQTNFGILEKRILELRTSGIEAPSPFLAPIFLKAAGDGDPFRAKEWEEREIPKRRRVRQREGGKGLRVVRRPEKGRAVPKDRL